VSSAPEPRSKSRQWLFRVLALVLVLVASEGLLRLAGAIAPPVRAALERPPPAVVPDDVLGVRPNPDLAEHDERGWRNATALKQANIVAIGDSQTYGTSVQSDEAWPTRLAERTGVCTYSMACGGYGPSRYLMLADEALELRPQVIVVGLYAGNDLADVYRRVYDENKMPELRVGAAPTAEAQTTEALFPEVEEVWKRTQIAATHQPLKPPGRSRLDVLSDNCKLLALVRRVSRSFRAKPKDTEWSELRRRADGVEPDLLLPHSDGAVQTLLTPALRFAVTDLNDERIAAGLRSSWEALRLIRDKSAPAARILVLLIPTKELVLAERVVDPPPVLRKLVESETELWRRTRTYLNAQGIPWVDGLVALRGAVARGENPYFRDHDGHPNPLGQDALAAAVAASAEVRRLAKP